MLHKHNPIPLLLIAYRRHDFLRRLLDVIPGDRNVYIVVDGAKTQEHEPEVALTRSLATAWAEERGRVTLHFRDHNMGGPDGIPAAIDFVFESENLVCIFEEDCIPSPVAFDYLDCVASELAANSLLVGGSMNNFVSARANVEFAAPFLSVFPHCWGWFTSKSAWHQVRPQRADFSPGSPFVVPGFTDSVVQSTFPNDRRARLYWRPLFRRLASQKMYHWDYALALKIWAHKKKFIVPPFNLVTNIGVGERSQNCKVSSPNHFLDAISFGSSRINEALFCSLDCRYDYDKFDRLNQRIAFPRRFSLSALRHKASAALGKVEPYFSKRFLFRNRV